MWKEIVDLVGSVPTNPVLREKASLFAERAERLEERLREVEKENSELRDKITVLSSEIAKFEKLQQFTEHEGALFKKHPEGGYHKAVYCPKCHHSTYPMNRTGNYTCDGCHWKASFGHRHLDSLLDHLEK